MLPAVSIVAIVYAARVQRLWLLGQYEEAERASRLARRWADASAAVVVLFFVVVVVLGVTGVLGE